MINIVYSYFASTNAFDTQLIRRNFSQTFLLLMASVTSKKHSGKQYNVVKR